MNTPLCVDVWVPQSCLHIALPAHYTVSTVCVCPAVGKRRVAPKIRISGCDVHFVTCSSLMLRWSLPSVLHQTTLLSQCIICSTDFHQKVERIAYMSVEEEGVLVLCRKPRGLLMMTIGRSGLLGVESGGGPEDQDEKLDRGVH